MGVVHHSHYPVYMEVGRSEFFEEHLLPYQEFEAQGMFAPVLQLELQIVGRATYGDVLHLTTRAGWMKGVRLMMSYRIETQSGAPVATGQTLHALVGADLKAVHPRKFQEFYNKLRTIFGC